MTDKRTKCHACGGRGYFRCDCWPADCICGQDEETCWECNGDGWLDPSYDPFDGHCEDNATPPAPLKISVGDDQPRYTTKRMHDEIDKAKAFARREALEEAAKVADSYTFHVRMNSLLIRNIQDETQCPPCSLAADIRALAPLAPAKLVMPTDALLARMHQAAESAMEAYVATSSPEALMHLRAAIDAKMPPPQPHVVGSEDDETYEIGKRDGYSEAVQQIDQLTGGDGEYRYCTDHDPDRHTPGPAEMIQRIVDRFETLNLLRDAEKTGRDQEWGISAEPQMVGLQTVSEDRLKEALKLLPQVMRSSLSDTIIAAINEQSAIIDSMKRTLHARRLAYEGVMSEATTPAGLLMGSETVAIQALKKIEAAALGGYLTPDLCAEIVTSALAPEATPTSSFDVESWAAGDGVWNGDKWVPAGNSEGKR